jgi:hypothetical protein
MKQALALIVVASLAGCTDPEGARRFRRLSRKVLID